MKEEMENIILIIIKHFKRSSYINITLEIPNEIIHNFQDSLILTYYHNELEQTHKPKRYTFNIRILVSNELDENSN